MSNQKSFVILLVGFVGCIGYHLCVASAVCVMWSSRDSAEISGDYSVMHHSHSTANFDVV